MKKICFITTIQLTMETFIDPFAKVLAESGYDVTLVCNMNKEFEEKVSSYAKCINLPMRRGFHFFDIFKFTRKLRKIFKKERFDAIYYATDNASFYSSIAGKLARIPVRIYAQWGIHYVAASGFTRKIMKFLEKTTCKKSTVIRAQSAKNMQFAINEGLCKPNKIAVLGIGGTIGVDLNEYDLSKKQEYREQIRTSYGVSVEDFVFGFVGRINKDKGCIELLKAFLNGEFDCNTKLMMVGMYDDCEGEMLEMVNLANESNKVIFTGHVKGIDVCKYLSAFDVLVHPTYREGFGKVLQEGLAMALPIITTDVPGPSEVVEDEESGILVPARNVEELREEMKRLIENKDLRNKLSLNGRKRAEKYFERSIMINNILIDIKGLLEE